MRFGWMLSDGEMEWIASILGRVTTKSCTNKDRKDAQRLLTLMNNNLSQKVQGGENEC